MVSEMILACSPVAHLEVWNGVLLGLGVQQERPWAVAIFPKLERSSSLKAANFVELLSNSVKSVIPPPHCLSLTPQTDDDMTPCLCLGPLREVKANFGEENFQFDIYSFLKDRDAKRVQEIDQVLPPPSLSLSVSLSLSLLTSVSLSPEVGACSVNSGSRSGPRVFALPRL
jgi:hypothetical protein